MRTAALAVAVGLALLCVPPAANAHAAPEATPLGPLQPTEQHTRCARAASGARLQTPPGHVLLDIAGAHRFSRGAGTTVAVIDTGVSPHSRLPGVQGGGDYVAAGDGLTDCDLHGTIVAGLIAAQPSPRDGYVGVAPAARIISIRQSSGAYRVKSSAQSEPTVGAGYGPLATLAKALVRAVDLGADVINVSEAACLPAGEPVGDDAVRQALQYAAARDVIVVVAAGNLSEGTMCRTQNESGSTVATVATPGRLSPLVVTVGATNASDGNAAPFSLRGPWVDIAAPGTDIVGIGPSGRAVAALAGERGDLPLAGTSYAAPYVAGTAALVRSRFPNLSATQVIDRILRTAHGGGSDSAVGRGIVDPVAALTAVLPTTANSQRPAAIAVPAPDQKEATGLTRLSAIAILTAAAVTSLAVLAARHRGQPGSQKPARDR